MGLTALCFTTSHNPDAAVMIHGDLPPAARRALTSPTPQPPSARSNRQVDKWGHVESRGRNSRIIFPFLRCFFLIADPVCHCTCVWDVNTRLSDDKITCGQWWRPPPPDHSAHHSHMLLQFARSHLQCRNTTEQRGERMRIMVRWQQGKGKLNGLVLCSPCSSGSV